MPLTSSEVKHATHWYFDSLLEAISNRRGRLQSCLYIYVNSSADFALKFENVVRNKAQNVFSL